jgi:hypothetical protein
MTNPFDDVDPLRALAFPFEQYPENGLVCSCGRPQRVTSDGPICKLGHREPGQKKIEELIAASSLGTPEAVTVRELASPVLVEAVLKRTDELKHVAVGEAIADPYKYLPPNHPSRPKLSAAERTVPLFPGEQPLNLLVEALLKRGYETNLVDVAGWPVLRRDVARAWAEQGGEPPEWLVALQIETQLEAQATDEAVKVKATTIRVSHSELACFRRCPREHHYRYVLRRESRTTAEALMVGRRIDTAIKDLHRQVLPDLTGLKPAERALVQAYAIQWKKSELHVDECDVPFEFTVGNVTVVGELDAIGTEHKRRVLIELKTTGEDISPGSTYWQDIVHMDPQVTFYLQAAKALGWGTNQMIWDAVRKPLLKQKQKESEADFELRILADIAERPAFYFQRQPIVRHEAEHEAHVRDLNGVVHLMQVVREMPEAPRNVDACWHFGRPCDFLSTCEGETSINDDFRYQSRERKQRPAIFTPSVVDGAGAA